MKAQYLEEYDSKRDVCHEKFGWFLTDIFKALGITKKHRSHHKGIVRLVERNTTWWKKPAENSRR
jgi:hypothetical protein